MLVALVALHIWPSANSFWLVRFSDTPTVAQLQAAAVMSDTIFIEKRDSKSMIVWAGPNSRVSGLMAEGAWLVTAAEPAVGCGPASGR
ncbi:MAG: hypothetical protein EP335_13340 [Alphaproteobacteria bacterium]|nr:MAG: hypothetical protein EP335_13340 [Alphaproteobacteria bacterium]